MDGEMEFNPNLAMEEEASSGDEHDDTSNHVKDEQRDDNFLNSPEYRKLTPQEKRKERNKILARKSRMRLKGDLEALKAKLAYLVKENEALRSQLIKLPSPSLPAQALMAEDVVLPENIMNLVHQLTARTARGQVTKERLKDVSFCIANALSAEMPLIYVSPGFAELTGYEMHEILGRNCRFLQGPLTDPAQVAKLRHGLQTGQDCSAILLNYTKSGEVFWNHVVLAHLKDARGVTFYVVGIQTKLRAVGGGMTMGQHGNERMDVAPSNGKDDTEAGRGVERNGMESACSSSEGSLYVSLGEEQGAGDGSTCGDLGVNADMISMLTSLFPTDQRGGVESTEQKDDMES